jgi:hypothetical protein
MLLILLQSFELTPENISIFGLLLLIIGYLLREKEQRSTQIKDLEEKINELQNQRLEDQKQLIELSISLVKTIEKVDGYRATK